MADLSQIKEHMEVIGADGVHDGLPHWKNLLRVRNA